MKLALVNKAKAMQSSLIIYLLVLTVTYKLLRIHIPTVQAESVQQLMAWMNLEQESMRTIC